MSGKRDLWLTSHLLEDAAGAASHRDALALGRAAHQRVLALADRLAEISPMLAQQAYRQAAAVWSAFGQGGLERWIALGERLATEEPVCRDGAMLFFAAGPTQLGPGGLDTAAAWCELARGLADTSPKLASIFLKTTVSLLRRPDALERLRAWVEVGRGLYDQHGWQGEFLAQAYFSAAPRAVLALGPQTYRLWAGAGAALHPSVKERDFFGALGRVVRRWSEDDRVCFLRTTLALVPNAPKAAFGFYRDLPAALEVLSSDERSALLRIFSRAVKRLGAAIAEVAPVAGVLLHHVPTGASLEALRLIDELAAVFPEAVAAALRSLPKVYEEADPRLVREWFAKGAAVAVGNPQAGLAYFALESRTSLRVLRAASTAASLEESQGLLRKYVQMLSGQPVSIRAMEGIALRPALEELPEDNEVALPLRIDLLPTQEDNLRVYRFLAAHLAGRREFGTYDFVPPEGEDAEAAPGSALLAYLDRPEHPQTLADFFLLAEGIRIQHRLGAEYAGFAEEGRWVATRALEAWREAGAPTRGMVFDGLFAVALLGREPELGPAWLDRSAARIAERLLAPLADPSARVDHSMQAARALANALAAALPRQVRRESEIDGILLDRVAGDALLDPYLDEDAPFESEAPRVPTIDPAADERKQVEQNRQLELSPDDVDAPGASQPLSPEELQRLLDSGARLRISQGTGTDVDGLGLYITDLIGKIPSEDIEALRQLLGPEVDGTRRRQRRIADEIRGEAFWYDEWDYHIGDYRSRWCRLSELSLDGDSGEFFQRALSDYSRVIPEVRRQFQRIRPEMYRTVRGLEDGEDFDLNAAIDARIEARAGRAPSSKLYLAKKREQRDVATLFLLDMSASTDEPLAKLMGEGGGQPTAARVPRGASRRIIDVTKETLVVMVEALEEIGDAYAIYGFSGHGRENVEVYRVKSFSESLTSTVKGRLGAIEPKRSTRMGSALRHAIEKLSALSSRSKHLFLLSDGFPQDFDYGQDRRSNVYGIRDTAAALREAEAAGITPFCITVDKAGHDYLRQMCDESRYMVIEDITALPRELPKIYQRVVRV